MLDVLIVEDDSILLDFLSQEVSNQINVPERHIRKASSLKQARSLIVKKKPDWILLDLCLPDGSGVELVEQFLEDKNQIKVLILTAQADQFTMHEHVLNYVHALIDKADGLSPLRESIRDLCRQLDTNLPDLETLTPRQIEFLRLIGEGLDTSQISKILKISFSTAQTHRRQITRRLGIKGPALVTLARNLPDLV